MGRQVWGSLQWDKNICILNTNPWKAETGGRLLLYLSVFEDAISLALVQEEESCLLYRLNTSWCRNQLSSDWKSIPSVGVHSEKVKVVFPRTPYNRKDRLPGRKGFLKARRGRMNDLMVHWVVGVRPSLWSKRTYKGPVLGWLHIRTTRIDRGYTSKWPRCVEVVCRRLFKPKGLWSGDSPGKP